MFDWVSDYWRWWGHPFGADSGNYYVGAVVTVFLLLGLLFLVMYTLVGLAWLFRWTPPGRAFWNVYLRDRTERHTKQTLKKSPPTT